TQTCDDCPKLDEIARVLDEVLSDPDVKVIIFSEWEGMLKRVRAHADTAGIGYAWHTGSVPQQRRRAEILAFRQDPSCRLFLSTDSGGVGLNLQNASVVINCDLPWNPAKLEQRIARAWRKNQLRPVTVINLVAENTIEHGMLGSLANKQELAHGVLDGEGDLSKVTLKRGRQDLLKRLEQALAPNAQSNPIGYSSSVAAPPSQPASDPAAAFAATVRSRLADRLVRCDEVWLPANSASERSGERERPDALARSPDTPTLLCVVKTDATAARPVLETLLADTPWRGDRPALQVIDESTWTAIEQLRAAGLLTLDARITRDLLTADPATPPIPPPAPPLTPEQQARLAQLRDHARRKARAAQALLAADLPEEADAPLQSAALAHAQATAIAARTEEPSALAKPVLPADATALLQAILIP
ncbi:MAG: C-terminal helicase domain-containing protein, partial [Opitutaceae bacterium]